MQIAMDSAGRIVIPKSLRTQAQLEPGQPLNIEIRDGALIIEPRPLDVELRKRGVFLIAYPTESVPPLTEEVVEKTIAEVRSR